MQDANVTIVNVTPPNVVPRLPRVSTGLGWGALLSSMLDHDMIATPVDSPSIKNTSQSGAKCDTPAFHGENYGFERSDQPNQWQTMADLMKQLGSEIGNQIAASLSSAGQNVQRDHLSAQHPSAQPNLSNLNLVIRHQDIKEPPTFRGYKTDRCTIGEWEELMQTYLNKKGYSVSEQGQEIQVDISILVEYVRPSITQQRHTALRRDCVSCATRLDTEALNAPKGNQRNKERPEDILVLTIL